MANYEDVGGRDHFCFQGNELSAGTSAADVTNRDISIEFHSSQCQKKTGEALRAKFRGNLPVDLKAISL